MFTGIIMAVGRVTAVQPTSGGVRLHIDAGGLALDDVAIGDSIAVNGACLTAIAITAGGFGSQTSRVRRSHASRALRRTPGSTWKKRCAFPTGSVDIS